MSLDDAATALQSAIGQIESDLNAAKAAFVHLSSERVRIKELLARLRQFSDSGPEKPAQSRIEIPEAIRESLKALREIQIQQYSANVNELDSLIGLLVAKAKYAEALVAQMRTSEIATVADRAMLLLEADLDEIDAIVSNDASLDAPRTTALRARVQEVARRASALLAQLEPRT